MYGLYGCGLPLAHALPMALPAYSCGLGLNLACGARYLW